MDEPNLLRHLRAAKGFFELGMWEDAWDQLDEISPQDRVAVPVLLMRLEILVLMKRYESAVVLAESLISKGVKEKQPFLLGAYAARHCRSMAEGELLLRSGEEILTEDALFHYNLACYACVGGRLEEAMEHLRRASKIDPSCWTTALKDIDLELLWSALANQAG